MDEAFAVGRVWHRREGPREHRFDYSLYFSLLDCDRITETFARSRLWSLERFNLVTFRRRDHLAPHHLPLGEAVRERVHDELGVRPEGQVLVLTHLRQWGLCFNPVSFYFCLDSDGDIAFIVGEVHNTPWNERHAYVMDARGQAGPEYRFAFDKAFHVSPFLPLAMHYDWRFGFENGRLRVHMTVTAPASDSFTAGMLLKLRPVTQRAMVGLPLRFPFLTARVVVGIYWQAFRLWLKKTPFHPHPDRTNKPT